MAPRATLAIVQLAMGSIITRHYLGGAGGESSREPLFFPLLSSRVEVRLDVLLVLIPGGQHALSGARGGNAEET